MSRVWQNDHPTPGNSGFRPTPTIAIRVPPLHIPNPSVITEGTARGTDTLVCSNGSFWDSHDAKFVRSWSFGQLGFYSSTGFPGVVSDSTAALVRASDSAM